MARPSAASLFRARCRTGRLPWPVLFIWTQPDTKPNTGSYEAQWIFTPTHDSDNYNSISGMIELWQRSSGSGGASHPSSGNWSSASDNKTETTENLDGSTTTTTISTNGTVTETIEKNDGSVKTTIDNQDGSSSMTTVDTDGKVEAEVRPVR